MLHVAKPHSTQYINKLKGLSNLETKQCMLVYTEKQNCVVTVTQACSNQH